jgi:hypothetical protein
MSLEIYGLVYMSKPSVRFAQSDLVNLLNQSRRDNLQLNVTGLLLYADRNFMQLLEGSRENVEKLMGRIKIDPRHHDVHVLEEGPVPNRYFAQWSMAFLDFASPQVRMLPGYSTFLESPFRDQDMAEMSMRNVRLLHYFKSVMTASNTSMLKLAETIDPPIPPGSESSK